MTDLALTLAFAMAVLPAFAEGVGADPALPVAPLVTKTPIRVSKCLAVGGDRITAGDLTAADARFSALPADLAIAFSPFPGASRTFGPAELQRIARSHGLNLSGFAPGDKSASLSDFHAACFDRLLPTLTSEGVRRAAEEALAKAKIMIADLRIDVVEISRHPVPTGNLTLELPFASPAFSGPSASRSQLWKGCVVLGSGRRFPMWARLSLHGNVTRVVAIRDLLAGENLEAGMLRLETSAIEEIPISFVSSLAEAIGRSLKQPVRAGMAIPAQVLDLPNAVRVGDRVSVEVRQGRAHLLAEGKAEANGKAGQLVSVRNPESGKRFSALVVAPGKVLVSHEE